MYTLTMIDTQYCFEEKRNIMTTRVALRNIPTQEEAQKLMKEYNKKSSHTLFYYETEEETAKREKIKRKQIIELISQKF